jgi:hypothetical protein
MMPEPEDLDSDFSRQKIILDAFREGSPAATAADVKERSRLIHRFRRLTQITNA